MLFWVQKWSNQKNFFSRHMVSFLYTVWKKKRRSRVSNLKRIGTSFIEKKLGKNLFLFENILARWLKYKYNSFWYWLFIADRSIAMKNTKEEAFFYESKNNKDFLKILPKSNGLAIFSVMSSSAACLDSSSSSSSLSLHISLKMKMI